MLSIGVPSCFIEKPPSPRTFTFRLCTPRELKFFPAETTNPKTFTQEQLAHFNEKGYIFPIDLFAPDEATHNREYFERLLGMAFDAGLDRYSINGWQAHCQGVYDLVMNERILGYVEEILGPNLVVTQTRSQYPLFSHL